MLVLCGFSASNYYNKVKLALLEKGLAFTEEHWKAGGTGEAMLAASPLGKIPFIRTEHGTLCESQAILDYLETAYPTPALLPADAWQSAKVREIATFMDLHVELVARDLYGKAFFGTALSDAAAAAVRTRLEKNIGGFKRLASFAPFVAGAEFTQADCSAWASLPLISMATRAVYGEDLLATAGIDWKAYVQRVGERPSAQKVTADRKADQMKAATPS